MLSNSLWTRLGIKTAKKQVFHSLLAWLSWVEFLTLVCLVAAQGVWINSEGNALDENEQVGMAWAGKEVLMLL